MANFPDKSNSGNPEKKIQPVIPAATVSSRGSSGKLLSFLFAESPRDLATRIGREVMVPRIKAGIEASLNAFISGAMWGGGPRPFDGVVGGTVLRAGSGSPNYNVISSGSALQQAQAATTMKSSGVYKNVVCATQDHAEILLANLMDSFNHYNVVAVADLYEMAGIKPAPADNAYGWLSLDGARIVKSRDGFELELPRPTRI